MRHNNIVINVMRSEVYNHWSLAPRQDQGHCLASASSSGYSSAVTGAVTAYSASHVIATTVYPDPPDTLTGYRWLIDTGHRSAFGDLDIGPIRI